MVEQTKGSVRPERDVSRKRARLSAHVSVHTIRDLLDLVATDLPAVAVEGGIFRVQPHAYDGFLGRDPGLSRLAAAVIGDSATDRRLDDGVVPVRPQDCEPLPLFARGIDLDAFRAGQGKDEAEERFRGTLNRLCRRTDALGAALLVRDRSGGVPAVAGARHPAAFGGPARVCQRRSGVRALPCATGCAHRRRPATVARRDGGAVLRAGEHADQPPGASARPGGRNAGLPAVDRPGRRQRMGRPYARAAARAGGRGGATASLTSPGSLRTVQASHHGGTQWSSYGSSFFLSPVC